MLRDIINNYVISFKYASLVWFVDKQLILTFTPHMIDCNPSMSTRYARNVTSPRAKTPFARSTTNLKLLSWISNIGVDSDKIEHLLDCSSDSFILNKTLGIAATLSLAPFCW